MASYQDAFKVPISHHALVDDGDDDDDDVGSNEVTAAR